MAKVGLSYPVFAQISAYTEGSSITYGTGMVLGKGVTANTSWNRSNAKLYADNVLCETANEIFGGTIAVTVDDLDAETKAAILGLVAVTSGSGQSETTTYKTTDAAAPYVGFGCIHEIVKSGTHSYTARWYHKVQFSLSADEARTRGESTEFSTFTLDGQIMGVVLDATNGNQYMDEQVFATEATAKAWLKTKANIT